MHLNITRITSQTGSVQMANINCVWCKIRRKPMLHVLVIETQPFIMYGDFNIKVITFYFTLFAFLDSFNNKFIIIGFDWLIHYSAFPALKARQH